MVIKPMQRPVWQLENGQARMRQANLSACIDVSRPSGGLSELRTAEQLSGARILQVQLPVALAGAEPSVECYGRGGDLIATYAESPDWPFRAQIYWRALSHAASNEVSAVELVASVQTSLLDADPSTAVSSTLPLTEAHWLRDVASGQYETLSPGDELSFSRSESPVCCVVCRLQQSSLSYAEMVHPDNFYRFQLRARREPSNAAYNARLHHQLFPQRLEKGVILRARVLGVFLPRADDLAAAARHYALFAATGPPLTV